MRETTEPGMQIVYKSMSEIRPYEKNPRKNDASVKFVAQSIKDFGFKVPIVVDKDGVIIAGHTRYKAANSLGLTEVPVIIANDLDDAQVKAYRLADNKVGEFSEWDMDLLVEELQDLSDFDMEALGFDDLSIPELDEQEVVEDDYDEELPEEPKAKYGDVYQLGRHRLMCGDSTSFADVEKLLGGKNVDMVFTDPPYGMKKESAGVANDNLNYDDLLEFNRQWIPLTFDVLKDNGSWYCWGIDEPLMDIYAHILKPMKKANEITIQNYLTWDKGTTQGERSSSFRSYPVATEKCWFVIRGVQGYNTNSDNYFEGFEPIRQYLVQEWDKISDRHNWDELLGNKMGKHYFTKSQWNFPTREAYQKMQSLGDAFKRDYDELKRDYDELKRDWYQTRAYFDNTHDIMNDVWHFPRTGSKERENTGGHATPKPIALCCRAIKSSSKEGEAVLDVFGGSGSTLIACEQLNRTAYLMELEPKWVDVIIRRWEQFTGQKAELIKE